MPSFFPLRVTLAAASRKFAARARRSPCERSKSVIMTDVEASREDSLSLAIQSEPMTETLRDQVMVRLFSALQVARFNVIYYQRRSAFLRQWSRFANIVAALSASGAVIAILKQDVSGIGLTFLVAIAAVFAAVGPVLGLEWKASQLEKAAFGHSHHGPN